MNTEELRVKWLIKPPVAVLGPRRDGDGPSRSAVGGERGEAAAQRGLNGKLKAPGEPRAASSRFGFAGGRAPSAGCSSHGHLREGRRGKRIKNTFIFNGIELREKQLQFSVEGGGAERKQQPVAVKPPWSCDTHTHFAFVLLLRG